MIGVLTKKKKKKCKFEHTETHKQGERRAKMKAVINKPRITEIPRMPPEVGREA